MRVPYNHKNNFLRMKTKNIFIILFCIICLVSCELDNYNGPNATISGCIYDIDTKELIQQDIIQGAQIEYIEHGYNNPEVQYMIFKEDGTYRNNLMFANTYTIQPVRGNFVTPENQEIKVKGDTKLDFYVTPYIRVKNAEIKIQDGKIIATFNLQPTGDFKVKTIGLYAYNQSCAGATIYSVAKTQTLNKTTEESTLYSLELDLTNTSQLVSGKKYYFRVGALADVAEAKFNYATAVRIQI